MSATSYSPPDAVALTAATRGGRLGPLELGWTLFAAVGIAAMVRYPQAETVPFYLVWVSFSLVYGYRMWPWRPTLAVLGGVVVAMSWVLVHPVENGVLNRQEIFEVPLMATMFLVMVWHTRRRAEAESTTRRLLARERDFLRDASHELRTPLAIARGHLDLIHSGLDDPVSRADAETTIAQIDRMARITDRLLTMARLERAGSLHRVPVDLADLLSAVANGWSRIADRRWVVDVCAQGTICADAERIIAALDALVENAVAATEPGARITLGCHLSSDAAVIEVADEGIGIAPEHHSLVFRRFWRLEDRGGRRVEGSGLGLAIVHSIVSAHGGQVAVHSAPGKGTRFQLTVPLGDCTLHPTPARAASGEANMTAG